ncbi:hypothetical protein [Endozoicomonas sp. ALB115]|uniref:hypothetical protein n=1 Tax=Endozoicomonas sp. ALB115 TaxID=3403074 RepID=UPI003BB60D53
MYSKLINSLNKKSDKELKALMANAQKKKASDVIEAVTKEVSRRHPILANNCRGFDHAAYYGEGAVMDCVPEQLGKIKVSEIRDVVKFQYEGELVRIDTFTNCYPTDITIPDADSKEFSKHSGKDGICYFGDLVSSEVVTKEHAAKLFPKAFSKIGNFNQFTFKRA